MTIILKAEDISKTYHAGSVDVPALKKCSIHIEQGQFTAIVGIVGKSGSGKSTLLRILGTMDRPDGGTITIGDKDILKLKDKELSIFRRREIGFVYQDYSLFPEYTAYENIILPLVLDHKNPEESEVREMMDLLEISHCSDKFPGQMSGGEQQRVAIARALITHPAVVFADEPTGNLDAESAGIVAKMLSRAAQRYQQTIIMVTHDKQMADYADSILTIVDGIVSGN
ncbi:MAG: ABC transporter ATP-binding protein [Lachnospira sp.]|nr:ABC transporter ATP-binding protein [Lachnospira sp.]